MHTLGVRNISLAFCKACDTASSCVQDLSSCPGVIFKLNCSNRGCKVSAWYVCLSCDQRVCRSGLRGHLRSQKHEGKTTSTQNMIGPPVRTSDASTPSNNALTAGAMTIVTADDIRISTGAESFSAAVASNTTTPPPYCTPQQFQYGNLWLYNKFRDAPQPTAQDVWNSFGDGNAKMSRFWTAEHGSPLGCTGGGAQMLVGNALTDNPILSVMTLPSCNEAFFHLSSFIQYQSMSQKQRAREGTIQRYRFGNGAAGIGATSYGSKSLSQIYCSNAKHSIWSNLPIPNVQNIDGIGYVAPVDLLRFLFANGVPIDDCVLDEDYLSPAKQKERAERRSGLTDVFHISQSKIFEDGMEKLALVRKGAGVLHLPVVVVNNSWWQDGFGPNGVKNNRDSPVLSTVTFGPPKYQANTGNNTFPFAIGKKGNISWGKVAAQYKEDIEKLMDPLNPLHLYHGGVRRLIPVVSMELAAIQDKPERASVTKTMMGGTFHMSYSKLVRISEGKIYHRDALTFLVSTTRGEEPLGWGWSSNYLVKDTLNGCRLMSCYQCREQRLSRLGLMVAGATVPPNNLGTVQECNECVDWDLDSQERAHLMQSETVEAYPKKAADEDSPVPFPACRLPGMKTLPLVANMSWDLLIQAVRVAHYHGSIKRKKPWNMGQMKAYLVSFGVNHEYQDAVVFSAKKSMEEADYTSPVGLTPSLQFPTSWTSSLPMGGYIETPMHELFIGGMKTLVLHIDELIKQNRWGVTTFRRSIQPLLIELCVFGQSWLMVKGYNCSKKDEHGATMFTTGAWQGENHVGYCKVSPVTYLSLERIVDRVTAMRGGCLEIYRVVQAYHAFVSRVMTHGGMNPKKILDFKEYMKEFLSSMCEIDVRRHVDATSLIAEEKKILQMQKVAERQLEKKKQKAAKESKKRGNEKKQGDVLPLPAVDNLVVMDEQPGASDTVKGGKKRKGNKSTKADDITAESTPKMRPIITTFKWSIMCPNFMSLNNLATNSLLYGPMVNWWDGGGKGEKSIQPVKQLLSRGIPPWLTFFTNLLKRVMKARQIEMLEEMYGLKEGATAVATAEASAAATPTITTSTEDSTETVTDTLHGLSVEDDIVDNAEVPMLDYCDMENNMMSKTRTTYTYKTMSRFRDALNMKKPLAGILVDDGNDGLEMYCVVRSYGTTRLGWCRVTFNDSQGASHNGMWYAPISISELDCQNCPSSLLGIKECARMSGIAIPLWYVLGEDHVDALKFGVITNWWKPRHSGNRYLLPTMDASSYDVVPQSALAPDIARRDGELEIQAMAMVEDAPLLQVGHPSIGGSPARKSGEMQVAVI